MAGKTIQAAGGIVVRRGARPLIAVVQRSKDDLWVLPRGKLKRDENPVAGARREVVEETGHRVHVREFLGAITYRARGRPKVVQFWRMQAAVNPSRDIMADIAAVEWLPLQAAIRRLSYPLEKLFLRHVGRRAIPRRKHRSRRKARKSARKAARKSARKPGRKLAHKSQKQTRRRPAATARMRKTASHSGKAKSRHRKARAAARSSARHVPIVHTPVPAKRATAKRIAAKRLAPAHGVPQRPAPQFVTIQQTAIKPIASVPMAEPVAPATAAEDANKTILQRMLGRLAG